MIPIKNQRHVLWCKRIASSNILLLSFSEILVIWLYMYLFLNISFTGLQNPGLCSAPILTVSREGSLSCHPSIVFGVSSDGLPQFDRLKLYDKQAWGYQRSTDILTRVLDNIIFFSFKNDKYFSQFAKTIIKFLR